MTKLFYGGLAAYFSLRAIDLIIGSIIILPMPILFIGLFILSAILLLILAIKPMSKRFIVVTGILVIASFAATGFGLIIVGGLSAALRGLSVIVLALIFGASYSSFWRFNQDKRETFLELASCEHIDCPFREPAVKFTHEIKSP